MTWNETHVMDERLKFIAAVMEGDETMTALCERFGISRKTGYKWQGRYLEAGPCGLEDRWRAPLHHGRATDEAIVARLLQLKREHPVWGPKKLVARLRRLEPDTQWPAASTAGEILKRHGQVRPRRRSRLKGQGNGPWPEALYPNAVWTADHKGWFRTSRGERCEPLTVLDLKSRYCLALEALTGTSQAQAWPVFSRLFAEYGLPDALRSDNGPPFAGGGVTGLSTLAVRFLKLGIALQRIDPGKPQQNGVHERFHGHLLVLQAKPEASLAAQQRAFSAFRREYNDERPHEALGQTPPCDSYRKALRRMLKRMPEPDYPAEAAVRKVRSNGEIKWRGQLVHISTSLIGEPVAIEEDDGGSFTVRFYAHRLGHIDESHGKLRRIRPPLHGQPDMTQPGRTL
jgi:putative transposase